MSYALTLATFAGVHLMAAASPGPAFLAVTRVSFVETRRVALCSALGVAIGAMLWAVAAILGMHFVLSRFVALYGTLQVLGGAYLIWLGIQAWRHADDPAGAAASDLARMTGWQALRHGIAINVANPKVVVFFGSIFIALLTPDMPGWVSIAAFAIIAVNEVVWFTLVALLFSAPPAQSAYRLVKRWVDRAMGGVLIAFGLRLVLGSRG
jgi:threonine efflux protein